MTTRSPSRLLLALALVAATTSLTACVADDAELSQLDGAVRPHCEAGARFQFVPTSVVLSLDVADQERLAGGGAAPDPGAVYLERDRLDPFDDARVTAMTVDDTPSGANWQLDLEPTRWSLVMTTDPADHHLDPEIDYVGPFASTEIRAMLPDRFLDHRLAVYSLALGCDGPGYGRPPLAEYVAASYWDVSDAGDGSPIAIWLAVDHGVVGGRLDGVLTYLR